MGYLQYEVIPALNIFAAMIQHALLLEGDPNCPAPDSKSHQSPCSSTKCGDDGGCSSDENGQFCRVRDGAPFTTDYNQVKAQESKVSNTINTLLNEANALEKQPIVNITQLDQFANQFVALVKVMETKIDTKTCQWSKPEQICRYCGNLKCWAFCGCKGPKDGDCCEADTTCPTSSGGLNKITYLS